MNMTLSACIKKRNGAALGSPKSLRNNLYRSLGAKNFSTFWMFWNPIFGYYLAKNIFKPLKKILPVGAALLFTFIFYGILHDAVTTVFRGELSVFFSIWFLFMGVAVLISKISQNDFSNQRWGIRALINLAYIGFCLGLTVYCTKYAFVL